MPTVSTADLRAIYELTQAVSSARGLDQIFAAALDCLRDTLGVDRSAILLTDDGGTMRFQAWRGLSSEYRAAVDGHSPWGPADIDAQPIVVDDVSEDASLTALRGAIEGEGIRCLAFVPLVAHRRLLGKFMLYSETPATFSAHDVTTAQTIAAQVAFAIAQHRALDSRQRAADLFAGQKETFELLLRGAPLATVLDQLAGVAAELVPYRALSITTPQVGSTPARTSLELAGSFPVFSESGDEVGAVEVRGGTGPLTVQELEVVQAVAGTAAVAIERDRLVADRKRHRAHNDAIMNSLVAGIVEFDLDGQFQSVNDRYCQITGYSRAELLAKPGPLALTHPEDRPAAAEALRMLRETGDAFTIEQRYIRPDGTVPWVSNTVSALYDGSGTVSGAVAIVIEVTDRKHAEELVRDSSHRYRQLLESLDVAVYTTDAHGYLTLYNEAAVALWGRRPALGVDQWCGSWRIWSPDGREMNLAECPMARCLAEGKPVRGVEIVVERPDGTRANVLPMPTPLLDREGRLIGAVNVLVDVTEQKQLQRDLETALRAKDDFLGQVSHELRNPVAQVTGLSDVLVRRWQDLTADVRYESIVDIRAQSDRLRQVLENMLVLSRLERGFAPDVEPQLIDRLVDSTLAEFRGRFPTTDVRFSRQAGVPPAETNRGTIDQVLWNLLTNAQKYGPPRGPIDVTVRGGEGVVELLVADRGRGADDGDLARLFDPYFRSPNTENSSAGLGLGLSVCRRLLDAEGGEIWAERRTDGPGLQFGVRLRACLA